jgi:hypothetical protein
VWKIHRQQGDLISDLLFFHNRESRLKVVPSNVFTIRFSHSTVHTGFIVDEVIVGQVFLLLLWLLTDSHYSASVSFSSLITLLIRG